MNKKVILSIIGIVTFLALGVGLYFVSGDGIKHNEKSANITPTVTPTPTQSPTFGGSLKDLAFDENEELLKGFSVTDRRPRVKSDVDQVAIDKGWKEGYYVALTNSADSAGTAVITQYLSRYPLENLKDLFDSSVKDYEKLNNCTAEEISLDGVKADNKYSGIVKCGDSKTNEGYILFLTRKDVYFSIRLSGTKLDYEMIPNLANKVINKINSFN